ncbi:signal transduction histidine kinase [Sediminihabitans luteus]|uniref:Signal transduction histidine-protein kinase/phosphatase MprB n=1 Tax=Sediminihabitans luteus TaxID=1138585 RepID=A0A2M9CDP1_9CELL|nr:ATP-binding protein [Sediminihabitans luteus]PJJ69970.1 signal transduction histidine kinase [Sediminihabitans luteus]GII99290.1 two-component sensor histidine kinase [Sediminihabitans luteus]
MRRKVLQATVSAVVVAVLLLGLPLAIFGAQYVRDNEARELAARTETLARSVDARAANGEDVPQSTLDNAASAPGRLPAHILVVTPDGVRHEAGDPIDGKARSEVRRGESGALVTVEVSAAQITFRVVQIVVLVGVASFVAFAAGILVAVWQANRLAAPLVYLAASAEQLGSGQVRPRLEPSGVEEIDLVAAELARSADRMAGRLAAERQFASDASHQLRTPLTALSMRLEEISLASDDPDVQEEARISLEQVERLVTVVDDLLRSSRRASGGTTEAVRLVDVVRQLSDEWVPTFRKAERRLVIEVPEDEQVLATPGALAQVLATLVENSLKHGDGTTTVRSRPSGSSGAVVIEVADEGPGVPEDLAPRIFEREVTSGAGTGLGLALARDLAAADGGRLSLSQRVPAVFSYFLAGVPRTLDPKVVLPPGRSISSTGARKGWFGRP